ncbi:MAG: polymer-forming cytoskeletal protein, partial [Sinobacteraceae bacterium]|nr:polymer-forming cytoskeletal protein [Nevskiaceae bacterium]
ITSVGDKASLSISEGGVVEGSVNVDVISLNGTVVGDVHAAHNLTLGPKAKVTGDVEYTILEMEPGAAINGRLVHQGGAASPEALMHELGAARDSGAKSKQEAKLEPKLEPEVESV